jgi:hypothetical protein
MPGGVLALELGRVMRILQQHQPTARLHSTAILLARGFGSDQALPEAPLAQELGRVMGTFRPLADLRRRALQGGASLGQMRKQEDNEGDQPVRLLPPSNP